MPSPLVASSCSVVGSPTCSAGRGCTGSGSASSSLPASVRAGDPAEAPGGLESGPGARRRAARSGGALAAHHQVARRAAAQPRVGVYGAVASTGRQSLMRLPVEVTWRLVSSSTSRGGASPCPAPAPGRSARARALTFPALAATAGVARSARREAGDTLSRASGRRAALVLLAAFVVRERTTAAPLFDLDLLKDRGILGANICLLAYGASNAGEVLLVTLYLQEGRGLSPLFTGLCFIPQAAGAFALAGPASRIVPGLGPRRPSPWGLSLSVLALVGSALSVGHGSLIGLLVALFIMGISASVVQVASTLAGTEGPVAAKAEGSASALLTATRQIGSALGVAFLSATLVIAPGNASERTEVAMLAAALFSFLGLLATRIVPTGTAHPCSLRPEHLFGRHGEGLP